MSKPQTLNDFLATYGGKDSYPVVTVGSEHTDWPSVVVRYGDYAAVVQFMGVGDHLCIDVHPFAHEHTARASVFGMDTGRRIDGFAEADTDGTSQGQPAAAMVSVLIGEQADYDKVRWIGSSQTTDGWYLNHDRRRWTLTRLDDDTEIIVSGLPKSTDIARIRSLAEPIILDARRDRHAR